MKQDRFLTGILIGIALLVVVALVLFFVRKGNDSYVADDSVEGVLHNYVLAVQKQDYQKAYGYLADQDRKPSYEAFRRAFLNNEVFPGESGIEIRNVDITGEEALANLSIIYLSNDPFSTGYTNDGNALLVKEGSGWKILQMPYNYWGYDWYQPPAELAPVKP